MTREQLVELIKKSVLLSEEERAYWLKNLPVMNDEHLQKLETILSGTTEIPFMQQLENYVTALAEAAAASLEQKSA